MTAPFDFAPLLAPGTPPPAVKWNGFPKYNFVGGHNDADHVPLDQLLRDADFVSLHSPLTPATRHQIGARELALMKPTAFLINTARGAIVDEKALARALRKRQIAGAGLDVFEHEPQVTPALLKMANVVATPHLGSAVVEVREQMANIVVDNILALLGGKTPPNCINPEVLRR